MRNAPSQFYTIHTIAGSGPPNVGDGGSAVGAVLQSPLGVFPAPDGSVYIADTYNNRIRRVSSDGIIQTIAGTGTAEAQNLGDGLPATQAWLRFPRGVDLHPDGSLYIADSNHYIIRRIDRQGMISTVAGNRLPMYDGEGVPAKQASFAFPISIAIDLTGNLYIADMVGNRIRRVGVDGIIHTIAGTGESGSTGDSGPATAARIREPRMLALDKAHGLLYALEPPISLPGDFLVRQINLNTKTIKTIPGSENDGGGIAVDSAGNLVFLRYGLVWRLDPNTNAKNQIVQLSSQMRPAAFAIDSSGAIYMADSNSNLVHRIAPAGQTTIFAGGGVIPRDGLPAIQAVMYDSQGVAIDAAGNLFLSDFDHNQIRRIDRNGIVKTVAGNGLGASAGDGGHPLQASFSQPLALTFDPKGNLLFLDLSNGTGAVRIVKPGADGIVDGGADERILTVAGKPISRANADHGAADGGKATNAVFNVARGLCVDSRSNLYISDIFDSRIRKVTPGADGELNQSADEIISTIAGNGVAASTGEGGPAAQASVNRPLWIASDHADHVYVHEGEGAAIIRRISAQTGLITTYAHLEDLGKPWSFGFDAAGNLFFATGPQVYRIDAQTGARKLIAGYGRPGFSGDGGDARLATFEGAQFLAVSPQGEVFVADNGNFRIRALTLTNSVACVSAANYSSPVAGESIVSAFGIDLAARMEPAISIPLPTTLGDASLQIQDSAGTMREASLFFASPGQINFEMPSGTANGVATVSVIREGKALSLGEVTVETVAPGLFTADSSGQGPAAAVAAHYKNNLLVEYQSVAAYDAQRKQWIASPIDLGAADEQVYLLLFGTGVRRRNSVQGVIAKIGDRNLGVEYAGAVSGFIGLDQINLPLPRTLIGAGEVNLSLSVDGKISNRSQINLR